VDGSTQGGIIGFVLGLCGGLTAFAVLTRLRAQAARGVAEQIVANAHRESETILKQADLQAKEEHLQRREQLDHEIESHRRNLRDQERALEKRSDALDRRIASLDEREAQLDAARRSAEDLRRATDNERVELNRILTEQREQLLRASRLTFEEARAALFERIESELTGEIGLLISRRETMLRETSQQQAREILGTAIQRYAAGHTAEITVSTVDIPTDEMKGRIIGREGRNIRAFEKATGVDLIVDDTPGVVVVTGFDPIRREIAKLALEKLIHDGRIHPTRIEEVVEETRLELAQHIRRIGESSAAEAEVLGLHEKIVDYLGRLKFRTSYSQNVLQHSLEVAFLTGMLAEEIGLNGAVGRRCGLLHDLGKAADHEMEGGHPAVGAELLKRYGESGEVVHAAAGHHDDLRSDRPYTVLVAAADAISASRPGARRDTLEKYVRRLEELETLALGFPGVDQVFAIQAGREIRVLVDSEQLDDLAAAKLCRDIAREIQSQLSYPGEVKVTVLRETRVIEFAR
jgi:ribonuclease Y